MAKELKNIFSVSGKQWIISIIFASLATTTLFAQGKIQLKRPGAVDAAPAEKAESPTEVSLPEPKPAAEAKPPAEAKPVPEPKAPSEKITLSKPTDTSAAQAEGDYTTSKGPESKSRTLYIGPMLGFNFSGLANGFQKSPNAGDWDISPVLGLRSELYFKRVYGIVTDIGYEQNRSYLTETPIAGYASNGILRTDYILLRSMFSYRFSLFKVFGKIKFMRPIAEALKPFAGNLQAGFFAKTPLSAQLEILGGQVGDPNDPLYDVKSFTKPVSGGFMVGLGFELRLSSYIFFIEGQYFKGVLGTYSPITSRYFNTSGLSEHGIYFSSGVKTGIYGF